MSSVLSGQQTNTGKIEINCRSDICLIFSSEEKGLTFDQNG